MGMLEGKQFRKLIRSDLRKMRALSQDLKVRYPTYILKVHKLKETHENLHEKFPEVRAYSEEFKRRIKAFQAELVELETQLHDNLQKHAPIMDSDNVDGVTKKILWSDKQIQLTQLGTTLKTLAETERPVVPENYRSVLNRIHHDFKRLDGGVTLYHESLTACTSETAAFDTVLALKQEVEGVDALLSQHEAELQKLETDTQTQYEMSKMALSIFQERFEEFKAGCE
jgi:predicted  nucleic acid-binding Zn-ribbon protein